MINYFLWLPSVEAVLNNEQIKSISSVPRKIMVDTVRDVLNKMRILLRNGDGLYESREQLFADVITATVQAVKAHSRQELQRVINATGIVLHTNLGRALLSQQAAEAVKTAAVSYSNLEIDLLTGNRGIRYGYLKELVCRLCGAEDCLIVNNNAAAVLLALDTLACGQEAIVSRGQLVEIGGEFRIPEIMEKGRVILKEVGATNRTAVKDYQQAINENTGLLLRVHRSNFYMKGFTGEVSLKDLVTIGSQYHIPVMDDLGSGSFFPFADYGIGSDPTVAQSVASGADVITFSGDKLLGGPQAGIIVGKHQYLAAMAKNPLARAFRIDKLTIAALQATLKAYLDLDKAQKEVPVIAMLTKEQGDLKKQAQNLAKKLRLIPNLQVRCFAALAQVGGGALPGVELPSWVVGISSEKMTATQLLENLRLGQPSILAYIRDQEVLFDLRTLFPEDLAFVVQACSQYLS